MNIGTIWPAVRCLSNTMQGKGATDLRLSFSFFMTSFWRDACLERWNMDGSQLLERSTLMLGALPPRSCGSCKARCRMLSTTTTSQV